MTTTNQAELTGSNRQLRCRHMVYSRCRTGYKAGGLTRADAVLAAKFDTFML